jgi:hypothetical protein
MEEKEILNNQLLEYYNHCRKTFEVSGMFTKKYITTNFDIFFDDGLYEYYTIGGKTLYRVVKRNKNDKRKF